MNDLVDISYFEARIGVTLDVSYETPRAQKLLDTAARMVRGHCKQHITKATDTLVVPGRWSDRILLPERPVVDVSVVTATFYTGQAVTLPVLTWYLDRDELVRYPFPLGLQRFFYTSGNGWLGPGYKLAITYTHGYDPDASFIPPALALAQAIAAEMVARVWVNPSAAGQSMIGPVSAIYPAVGLLLTAEEKLQLNDVFRRTSQSIALR